VGNFSLFVVSALPLRKISIFDIRFVISVVLKTLKNDQMYGATIVTKPGPFNFLASKKVSITVISTKDQHFSVNNLNFRNFLPHKILPSAQIVVLRRFF